MELMGAIVGLEALTKPCQVTLVSDSKYVTDTLTKIGLTDGLKTIGKTVQKSL